MEVLILILFGFVALSTIINALLYLGMTKHIEDLILDSEQKRKIENPEPKVSDPFEKPKEVRQSTKSIVVPKTPQAIRNENYKKIKEGAEYGRYS